MNSRAMSVAVIVVAVLLATLGGYLIGVRDSGPHGPAVVQAPAAAAANGAAAPAAEGERKVLYWYDPMYPQHKFDKPGKSPYMDMQLTPKYADEAVEGGVQIDPALAQNLGMRTASVERVSMSTDATAVASVAFNDRDVAVVQARTGGFVERVYARAPGDVIAAGAPLADLLVSEWAGAQEEYLAVKATGDAELAAAARARLRLLGMSEAQIERIDESGQTRPVMTIAAPIGGVIQELGVRAGMSVAPGMTLARINGLRSVWLEAAVPEAQAGLLRRGRLVEARFAAYPDQVFKGKIAAILPEANVQTRTLRVRMEFPNPRQQLKAGMFAQVRIAGSTEQALSVPSEAVIRTGRRAVVFVSERPGQFRPVEVEVGREREGRIQVLRGLEEGQRVAVSGQFLIDSEASFQGVDARSIPEQHTGHATASENAARSDGRGTHAGTGKVTEIAAGEISLAHGPIPTLDWPPMTMAFKLPDAAAARALKPGDAVKFSFRQEGDDFVIDRIEKSAATGAAGHAGTHGGSQ
jgi:Cu(I)/Ag(I) efflux system membrane fusion protein